MNHTLRLLGLLLAGSTCWLPLPAQAKTELSKGTLPSNRPALPRKAMQPLTYHPISGYVFEDVNYGGGGGHALGTTGTVGRPGARVELYNSSGSFIDAKTTDANGYYNFSVFSGNYTVRVVNASSEYERAGSLGSS